MDEAQAEIAPPCPNLPPAARCLLNLVLKLRLVTIDAVTGFLEQSDERLAEYASRESFGNALVHAGFLTAYQLERVLAGTTHGLVLGNYRILSRLGAGAMGIVFLGEHLFMKRRAAIKVFPVDDDCPTALLERFYSEMRVQADLHHPNIATAYDAGRLPPTAPGLPTLLYLVMELVSGGDLEEQVMAHGPSGIAQACNWVWQAACGLQEAHDHHLIHRDVKPSNLLLNDQQQVKLVDFGLARQFTSRLTDPRALLGTVEYMAPEQSHDPSNVSAKADVYGLGATLFWLLTGEGPYPSAPSVSKALHQLQHHRPRTLRSLRPDASEELDVQVDRLLDPDPSQRPATPLAVMNALLPFALRSRESDGILSPKVDPNSCAAGTSGQVARPAASHTTMSLLSSVSRPDAAPRGRRVLVVDDDVSCCALVRTILARMGHSWHITQDGVEALAVARQSLFDLVLLDLNLPGLEGYEVCRKLREWSQPRNQKVLVISARGDQNQLAESLPRGADDYVPKPFGVKQLELKVQHALNLKDAQDRADQLARELLLTNRQLEKGLAARSKDVRQAQDALLFAMAKMAESRDGETAGHLRRLQRYTRCLAEGLAANPSWAGVADPYFLEQLERCVPLHDIGKIGLPDQVLLKPGRLDPFERELMQTHTVIGDRMLEALGREHGASLDFLGLATAVVRHHHERFDGRGYPDGLAGEVIPPAARLVALADVYDALRRRRSHKCSLTHADAVRIIVQDSAGHFDPAVVQAFIACDSEFEHIYRSVPM